MYKQQKKDGSTLTMVRIFNRTTQSETTNQYRKQAQMTDEISRMKGERR